ncbi:hypothetical protein EIN_525850 [Entamoeba invadens IP1]|uniref:Beta-lactamase-related domain-containing protein n=1 Tax=Entamoeba invadens IP1 TaxID=370355 RepID=A0A0A1U5Q9_ENTIV|nr:hypothetical protein EIN_525850 [Entamoeba invadens IP1]ELP89590.1 hypothetical protein EIN_525850 [Entamoeba invadens IP1]|eukprot:XP_004256361.1 hypothetical protein EIN_525850 [Entamoeba invadens IP1]
MVLRHKYSHDDNKYFKTTAMHSEHQKPLKRELQDLNEEDLKILKEEYNTYAFLVMKKDKIVIEKYFDDTTAKSTFNPFSATKTIVSILFGIALDKQYITSIDDKVDKYFPTSGLANSTLKDVLRMESGLGLPYPHWLLTFGRDYFASNLTQRAEGLKPQYESGKYWVYSNMNTQTISQVIERATHLKLSQFAQEHLWKYISTADAEWCMDESDNVKAYCCFYMTSEDFLRLGKLVLDKGSFNNNQIISTEYLSKVFVADGTAQILVHNSSNIKNEWYGLQGWRMSIDNHEVKYFSGIGGQLVIIIEDLDLVISRFGFDKSVNLRRTVEPLVRRLVYVAEHYL